MTISRLFYDRSITSLTGSSQQALALNGQRQFLALENAGTSNVGVNFTGGTAVIGGAGTLTMGPGDALWFDKIIPQNAVNVIGTAGQALVVVEG